jgi:hypothetical protein
LAKMKRQARAPMKDGAWVKAESSPPWSGPSSQSNVEVSTCEQSRLLLHLQFNRFSFVSSFSNFEKCIYLPM